MLYYDFDQHLWENQSLLMPFQIVWLSRITAPLDVAEIEHVSQVTLSLAEATVGLYVLNRGCGGNSQNFG
jgi:hypothetical protein